MRRFTGFPVYRRHSMSAHTSIDIGGLASATFNPRSTTINTTLGHYRESTAVDFTPETYQQWSMPANAGPKELVLQLRAPADAGRPQPDVEHDSLADHAVQRPLGRAHDDAHRSDAVAAGFQRRQTAVHGLAFHRFDHRGGRPRAEQQSAAGGRAAGAA